MYTNLIAYIFIYNWAMSMCNICSGKATVVVQVGIQVYHGDSERSKQGCVNPYLIVYSC